MAQPQDAAQQTQVKSWVRRALLFVNLALVAYVMASAREEGIGLEVAETWMAVTGFLSQSSLLMRLLGRPRTTAPYVFPQCLGIFAACHASRLLGASRWSMDNMDLPMAYLLAALAVLNFSLATWHRRALQDLVDDPAQDPAVASSGTPFGAELVRRFQGPQLATMCRRPAGAFLWACLEHAILPGLALLLGALAEGAAGLLHGHTGRHPLLASWHQALEALALLPQLRVLLASRVPGAVGGATQVPPDLSYWLVCMAVGHLFAFLTALVDSLAARGSGFRALVLACGEGFNAAVLGELLVAHFRAKWRGDKQLLLPD